MPFVVSLRWDTGAYVFMGPAQAALGNTKGSSVHSS